MAVVDVLNVYGEKVSEKLLADAIFNVEIRSPVLHEVVKMQLAKKRSGTASVKRRSDVKGSGKKLYRQKGTGRARRGDIKSPILRGGGCVFGPSIRDYSYSLPKKVKRLAMKMALSSKLKEQNLIVLDKIEFDEIKTKRVVNILDALNIKKGLFIVDGELDNFVMSAKNIKNIKVLKQEGLNVYDVLKYSNLIMLESSIDKIEGRLQA
ncbi:MAG: 50S ribosomal protein L4 [Desulfobacterales bacterium]|nr:50S ribosomal protein L4 [Desulfobacterales bacterium]